MSTILAGHFYQTDSMQRDAGSISARLTFDVNHPIFKGHFPDMPVVPGVCQTQILGEIFSQALGNEVELRTAASIKFLSIVDPVKTPSLDLSISYTQGDDNSYNVSAQYTWQETVFFKFKGVYS